MLQCQLFKLEQGGLAAQDTVNIWEALGSSPAQMNDLLQIHM